MYNFIKYVVEGKEIKKLEQLTLSYGRDQLGKSLSKRSLDYHFGKLYRAYVDRYNSGEGDADFNEAGAFLHNIYFAQFRPPQSNNKPTGAILNFITQHFGDWDQFKKQFQDTAMKIQGSGWAYLSKSGEIKTIKNHEIKQDIIILVDWWEHAFNIDYETDKPKYLENQWKIMDWEKINIRLEAQNV
jgi:Fe-Mn family superoxide dismutase